MKGGGDIFIFFFYDCFLRGDFLEIFCLFCFFFWEISERNIWDFFLFGGCFFFLIRGGGIFFFGGRIFQGDRVRVLGEILEFFFLGGVFFGFFFGTGEGRGRRGGGEEVI